MFILHFFPSSSNSFERDVRSSVSFTRVLSCMRGAWRTLNTVRLDKIIYRNFLLSNMINSFCERKKEKKIASEFLNQFSWERHSLLLNKSFRLVGRVSCARTTAEKKLNSNYLCVLISCSATNWKQKKRTVEYFVSEIIYSVWSIYLAIQIIVAKV